MNIEPMLYCRCIIMAARLCMLLCIGAFGASAEKKVEATFVKNTLNDLDGSASGYIYQQHGNNPANVIYFNKGSDSLGRLNQGEMLSRLNRGESISDLNEGEILSHLHLKMNHGQVHGALNAPATLRSPALPYVYQQQSVGGGNPGRSTSQAYYVTHYQDNGHKGGREYLPQQPVSVSHVLGLNKGIDGGSYPQYDVTTTHGLYNPLALSPVPLKPKKTLGLGHFPTVDKRPESYEEDDDDNDEEDDDDDDDEDERHGTHDAIHDSDDDDEYDEYEGEDEDEEDSREDSYRHQTNNSPIIFSHGPIDHVHDYSNDNHNHKAGSGAEHEEEDHSTHSEKGEKAYNKFHGHAKGEKGHHDDAEHSKHYNEHSGHKAAGHDEAQKYGEHHAADHNEKGGDFQEKKAHKKGAKTTGYHNVFHKDEYKKVHTFYDDADHKGKFKKYGAEHKEHESKKGESAKGAHHHSGQESDHHGKKGHSAKGHYDKDDQGYKEAHGKEKFHEKESDYAKKGDKHGQSSHAHTDSGHY